MKIFKVLILVVTILFCARWTANAISAEPPKFEPEKAQAIINALAAQRNDAMDRAALLAAELERANAELKKLKETAEKK